MKHVFCDPFASYFMAGFECSTHRRKDGERLDLVATTAHDRHALTDYRLVAGAGMRTARDGLRWHLIEATPGHYDWSSWEGMLAAAERAGVQVIWDLWHYGTPDWLDLFSPEFPAIFAEFAAAAARVRRAQSAEVPVWCPLNEMSFFSFIAGTAGEFHPYRFERGHELKRQLVRAAVLAADALLDVDPRARLLWAEPSVHVHPAAMTSEGIADAEGWRLAQFQVYDMLSGRSDPELGGRPELLDIIGANFYPHNQWLLGATGSVPLGHHDWRPFGDMLGELHQRYGRPIIVAETGAEGSARAAWLHYVAGEADRAAAEGADIRGLCLYPIIQYPGWDDDRACETGLYGASGPDGERAVYKPLQIELQRQQILRDDVVAPVPGTRELEPAGGFMLRG